MKGVGYFASPAIKYLLIGLVSAGLGYWIIGSIKSAAHKISNYDSVASELEYSKSLVDQMKESHAIEIDSIKSSHLAQLKEQEELHNEEKAELEASRRTIDEERKRVQKRAFVEAGRLKKMLEESKEAKSFNDIPINDSFKQLRIRRGTAKPDS